jgi:nucleotide-binding universal stress UspA family protein
MDRILVGVDASDSSVKALRYAADEARRHGAKLEVVHVFGPPAQVTAFPVTPERGTDVKDLEQERAAANERLGQWLEEVDVDLSGIDVEWTVVAAPRTAGALIDRSADADLVVVGSRGRGGFKGLVLGSVSEQVVRHAQAPVLVTR